MLHFDIKTLVYFFFYHRCLTSNFGTKCKTFCFWEKLHEAQSGFISPFTFWKTLWPSVTIYPSAIKIKNSDIKKIKNPLLPTSLTAVCRNNCGTLALPTRKRWIVLFHLGRHLCLSAETFPAANHVWPSCFRLLTCDDGVGGCSGRLDGYIRLVEAWKTRVR